MWRATSGGGTRTAEHKCLNFRKFRKITRKKIQNLRISRQSPFKAIKSPKLKIVLDSALKMWYNGQFHTCTSLLHSWVGFILQFHTSFGAAKIWSSVPRGTIGKKKSAQPLRGLGKLSALLSYKPSAGFSS